MMKEIRITIAAEAGHGKTTIANHITNLLRCSGLNVDLFDEEGRLPLSQCAKQFATIVCNEDLHIAVETKQLGRPAFKKEN